MELSLSDAMLIIEEDRKKMFEASNATAYRVEEGKLRPRRHMNPLGVIPLTATCRGILDTLT